MAMPWNLWMFLFLVRKTKMNDVLGVANKGP